MKQLDRARGLSGFTLVELSIVLVILGLLVGGVLTGQSLIRAAELRSIVTDRDRYISAVYSFRDKYFALPGDVTNATAFWGKDNTNCSSHTGTTSTTGTCNGNGDGLIDAGLMSGSTTARENLMIWQHLANAGMIEGTYTGIGNPTIGTNVPRGKISNSGYGLTYTSNGLFDNSGTTYWGTHTHGNTMFFGGPVTAAPSDVPRTPNVLKPEEAWNIDTKTDDGRPGYGKMFSETSTVGCATTTSAATAAYSLSSANKNCAVRFLLN